MLQVIGVKRIIMLVVLVALNAALAAAVYMYVLPQGEQLQRDLNSTRAQIANRRTETDRLRNEFELIQEQRAYFEALRDAGFISDQNRLLARRRIGKIQQYSKVIKASYDISSANLSSNEDVKAIEHVILSSPMRIALDAFDDVDLFSFIYWMENAFPGHIAVQEINLSRELDINDVTLRAVGSGSTTPLVKGEVDLVWRTIVPQEDVRDNSFGSGGF